MPAHQCEVNRPSHARDGCLAGRMTYGEGVAMAGRTSAFVIVGEYSVGPFRTREWKARHGVALIEKHRPVWMPGPIAHALGEDMPPSAIYLPGGMDLAGELLIVLASVVVRDDGVWDRLSDLGGSRVVSDTRGHTYRSLAFDDDALSSGTEWPPDLVPACAEAVRDRIRLALVRLEPYSLLDPSQVGELRGWGLDVEEFVPG